MQSTLARSSHMLLARSHDLGLLRDLLQLIEHNAISRRKPMNHILNLRLCTEISHELLQLAQIVSRHSREEMMYCLELQAAMDEVEPWRARYVHCCTELALRKRLTRPKVCCARAPVRECDLHVQRHGY